MAAGRDLSVGGRGWFGVGGRKRKKEGNYGVVKWWRVEERDSGILAFRNEIQITNTRDNVSETRQ